MYILFVFGVSFIVGLVVTALMSLFAESSHKHLVDKVMILEEKIWQEKDLDVKAELKEVKLGYMEKAIEEFELSIAKSRFAVKFDYMDKYLNYINERIDLMEEEIFENVLDKELAIKLQGEIDYYGDVARELEELKEYYIEKSVKGRVIFLLILTLTIATIITVKDLLKYGRSTIYG